MPNHRSYTNEFKQATIKLAMDSASITATAKNIGVPEATLHTWVRNAKLSREQTIKHDDGTVNHVNVTSILDENKQLKKKLARLEQEKAILKNAAKYFAAEFE
jgi:transposase